MNILEQTLICFYNITIFMSSFMNKFSRTQAVTPPDQDMAETSEGG